MADPVLIIGAGPAGLACAATLKMAGVPARILEKETTIAPVWRRHYDRLHLHTHRNYSSLPGLPMPSDYPKYPSRTQVIAYLESYADHHQIKPEFDYLVQRIRREAGWVVEAPNGERRVRNVIIASGLASFPHMPQWPGMGEFSGEMIHSSTYKNADPYRGKSVLVVGFGNSGGEIAMDLADHGAQTTLAVRGPVNVVPRDIFGVPILALTIAMQRLPYALADKLNAPVLRLLIGDIGKLGLQSADKGPLAQVVEDGRIPLLDIGTLSRIRKQAIQIRPGVAKFDGNTVHFADDSQGAFDAVILATGFRPDLRRLLPDCHDMLTPQGAPIKSGAESDCDGLYFCSFRASPTGQLREISLEAEAIAQAIVARRNLD